MVHGAQVWDSMCGSGKKCGNSKPSFHVAFQHGSRIRRFLARVSQPGCGCVQPSPRRVCARDAVCCREKRHVHCGPSNPKLSDLTIAAWWLLLSITALWRCALLKQRTLARVSWRISFYTFFNSFCERGFATFLTRFPHIRASKCL